MGIFTNEKVTGHIYRIRGIGDVCMYYIKGKTSGALIDTGYGAGDLKGYIEETFRQPYVVLITHGHADHAGGIGQWDTVYMNHNDIELCMQRTQVDVRKELLRKTITISEYENEFIPEYEGEFLELYDGQEMMVDDVALRFIYAPGHTQGMMVILVKEDRTALFGDACGVFTFLFRPECSTVSEYYQTLLKLQSLDAEYDLILRQHGTCTSPKSLIQDNLEACEKVLNGTDAHIPFRYHEFDCFIAEEIDQNTMKRKDGRDGNIIYSMEKIR